MEICGVGGFRGRVGEGRCVGEWNYFLRDKTADVVLLCLTNMASPGGRSVIADAHANAGKEVGLIAYSSGTAGWR